MTTPVWFERQKDKILGLTREVIGLYSAGLEQKLDDLPETVLSGLNEGLERLETGRFRVAFVGQMKAGKSTLVNAMLFHRQVLPAATLPLTAKLSRVRHGAESKAVVHFSTAEEWSRVEARAAEEERQIGERLRGAFRMSGSEARGDYQDEEAWNYTRLVESTRERLGLDQVRRLAGQSREIPLEDLNQYVAAPGPGTPPEQGKYLGITSEVEVIHPLPSLYPSTVEFVDTPGTNDPDQEREKVTLDYLARADAIVLVLYAGQPGGREDLLFLKQKLLPTGTHKVVMVLNQFDMVQNSGERRDLDSYVRHLVVDSLLNPTIGGEVPAEFQRVIETNRIFPVSGMQALLGRSQAAIPDGDFYWDTVCKDHGISTFEDAVKASRIEAFETWLATYLVEAKGRALLEAPLGRSRAALATLARQGKLQLERIETAVANLEKNAAELAAEAAAIEQDLGAAGRIVTGLKSSIENKTRTALGAGRIQAMNRLEEVKSQIRETYEKRIDGFGVVMKSAIHELNADLVWRISAAESELKQPLIDAIQGLASRLTLQLKEEIDRNEKMPAFALLRDRLDELVYLRVTFTMPKLEVLTENERGWWQTTKEAVTPGVRRNRLKEQLSQRLTEFFKRCEEQITKAETAAEERVMQTINAILDEVTNRLERELADKQRARKTREDGSDTKSKQAALESERTALLNKRAAIESLLGRVTTLAERLATVANESEHDGQDGPCGGGES